MIPGKDNIVLIGMPGAGKSTIGVLLAKKMSFGFIDTDILIQTRQKCALQDIVDSSGHLALLEIEADLLLSLTPNRQIIATGGSAVYSEKAMQHLKHHSQIVFLNVDLKTLEKRLTNFSTRGIAKKPGQTLESLFKERFSLYEKYADTTIECTNANQESICDRIMHRLFAS